MKKILFVLFILPILIAGCSSDDDDDSKFDFDKNHIYGEWRVTHIKRSTDDAYIDITTPIAEKNFVPTYILFKSDGSYSVIGFFGFGSGKFEASGNKIITYREGEEFIRFELLSLTEKNAEAIMSELYSSSPTMIKVRKK